MTNFWSIGWIVVCVRECSLTIFETMALQTRIKTQPLRFALVPAGERRDLQLTTRGKFDWIS